MMAGSSHARAPRSAYGVGRQPDRYSGTTPTPGHSTAVTGQPHLNELLVAVATGDQHAFDLFYDRVARRIFGVVRMILRDAAQSEEVAQEVLLEVWRTAGRYTPDKGNAIAWVTTIARRRAVDRLRQAQASARREANNVFEAHRMRGFDDVAETVIVREERRQIRSGLAQLTDLQRRTIMLAYYHGMTYREVGEALHIPLGTVKTRIRDGLTRLRNRLGVRA